MIALLLFIIVLILLISNFKSIVSFIWGVILLGLVIGVFLIAKQNWIMIARVLIVSIVSILIIYKVFKPKFLRDIFDKIKKWLDEDNNKVN